jgi:hypothetical protein
MTSAVLPGHHPGGCTDFVIGADLGELAPGHRLIVRAACLRMNDRLWLHYAWTPGLTEPMVDSDFWQKVEYGIDLRPADLDYVGGGDFDGGEVSEGEIGYLLPPADARCVWFDVFTTADKAHRSCRLTIDLATGQAHLDDDLTN